MTGFLLAAVFAALLAALFAVLRAGYGDLRVSELPVLLLALLAGSGERGRLRLILRHREDRGQAPAQASGHEVVQAAGFGPVASMFLPADLHPLVTPEIQPGAEAMDEFRANRLALQRQAAAGGGCPRGHGPARPGTSTAVYTAGGVVAPGGGAGGDSFWAHIEEARRLTGQIKAANGVPPAAIGDETADDERLSNLRWERPS